MTAFVGTICVFGFNYPPYSWALCQGQTLAIQSNTTLFSLIGTYYGGNGTSTFQLPNLQGRVATDQGQLQGGSNYVIGEQGGSSILTVISSNLPSHTHGIQLKINASTTKSTQNPSGAYPGNEGTTKQYNAASAAGVFMVNPTITLGNTGGTQAIGITDPSLVMNYCIALYGVFPARN